MELLENGVRLSDSVLWSLQKEAYCSFGPKSWTLKGVPFQISSNAFLARQYAQIAFSFLQQATETVYFLELGAGSGKFAYLFLRELLSLIETSGVARRSFRYILSDIAEKNVRFWQSHPLLFPFIEEGLLDVCVFDPLVATSLYLEAGKETLESISNPVMILANYFFDSITQDLFCVKDKALFEGRVSLSKKHRASEIINSLQEEYSFHHIENVQGYYPGFPSWDLMLEDYRTAFTETAFLFPVGALLVLEKLKKFCVGSCMVLAGDKGVSTKEQVASWRHPKLNRHGTFSFPVNFHLMRQHLQSQGEEALVAKEPLGSFSVHLFTLNRSAIPAQLKGVFQEQFDHIGVLDSSVSLGDFEARHPYPALEDVVRYLKSVNWDGGLFFYLLERVQIEESDKELLLEVLDRILARFFPLAQQEGLLVCRLTHLLQSWGVTDKAEGILSWAKIFASLPQVEPETYDMESIDFFIDSANPSGNTLQIGFGNEAICAKIASFALSKHTIIPLSNKEAELAGAWAKVHGAFLVRDLSFLDGLFDKVLFIPPYQTSLPKTRKGSFSYNALAPIKALEKQLEFLKEMVYSDADIAEFFVLLKKDMLFEPIYLINFFYELRAKANITEEQLSGVICRLQKENLITEEDLKNVRPTSLQKTTEFKTFFSCLKQCLSGHMKKGASFHGYLYDGASKDEDVAFLEQIISNPFLDYSEDSHTFCDEGQVQLIYVKKFD
jgi:hypothetical protein